MSKKDRLKAQKEKQDILKRELEEQERDEREAAKETQSKAARKMRRKAKRWRPNNEPVYCLILKILMLVPFGYSAFFYGGVLTVGIFGGYVEPVPPKWVGICTLCGIVLMGVGIFFAFYKKYIVSFILNLGGTIVFLKAAQYMITNIQQKLENYSVEQDLQNMDKEYMWYYYPVVGVIIISLALLVAYFIRKALKKKQIQHEKDIAPVKSIIDMKD